MTLTDVLTGHQVQYRICWRCGIEVHPTPVLRTCTDCKSIISKERGIWKR